MDRVLFHLRAWSEEGKSSRSLYLRNLFWNWYWLLSTCVVCHGSSGRTPFDDLVVVKKRIWCSALNVWLVDSWSRRVFLIIGIDNFEISDAFSRGIRLELLIKTSAFARSLDDGFSRFQCNSHEMHFSDVTTSIRYPHDIITKNRKISSRRLSCLENGADVYVWCWCTTVVFNFAVLGDSKSGFAWMKESWECVCISVWRQKGLWGVHLYGDGVSLYVDGFWTWKVLVLQIIKTHWHLECRNSNHEISEKILYIIVMTLTWTDDLVKSFCADWYEIVRDRNKDLHISYVSTERKYVFFDKSDIWFKDYKLYCQLR